jgi:hypothetical protein
MDKSVETRTFPLAGTTVSSALLSVTIQLVYVTPLWQGVGDTYEYKSYPADIGLPRVGTRPLGESFWTRREACSNAFGGIVVEVGELIDGDMVLAFF